MPGLIDSFYKVKGRGEYLKGGSLDKYEYVHQCYKYDRLDNTLYHSNTKFIKSIFLTQIWFGELNKKLV